MRQFCARACVNRHNASEIEGEEKKDFLKSEKDLYKSYQDSVEPKASSGLEHHLLIRK